MKKGIKRKYLVLFTAMVALASLVLILLNSRTEEVLYYEADNNSIVVIKGTPHLDLSMNYTISVHHKNSGDILFKKTFETLMYRDHRGGWGLSEEEYDIEISDGIINTTIFQDIAFIKILKIDTISGECEEKIIQTKSEK